MIANDATLLLARGLTKKYGSRTVLHGVDLDIPRGAVTAIVGPNGAGKTTLNRILLGLVRADSGRVDFDGVPLNGDVAYRARIGYMPQAARFPENLTTRDVIALLDSLRGAAASTDNTLVDAFALAEQMERPVRVLSGGQRQRLNAALAFRYRPELLLLDEPTAGLDPIASRLLKEAIQRARRDGAAVIITSHVLAELQEIADRVLFLLEGRVHYAGPMRTLLAETGSATLEEAVARVMSASESGQLVEST